MKDEPAFKIVRKASRREVIQRFLAIELEKPRYSEAKAGLSGIQDLSDAEFFAAVRRFIDSRDDTNPFFVFTVGVGRDDRSGQIVSWVLACCRIEAFYTAGVNPKMKADLASVGWNLKRFVALARNYPEFELNRVPTDELTSTVVGIECKRKGYDGSVELIDGSHRVVSLAAQGVEMVRAYIGQMR